MSHHEVPLYYGFIYFIIFTGISPSICSPCLLRYSMLMTVHVWGDIQLASYASFNLLIVKWKFVVCFADNTLCKNYMLVIYSMPKIKRG